MATHKLPYTGAEIEEMLQKAEEAMPKSGGAFTGNITGKYIIGTWLQATANNALATKPPRICVQDSAGWIYSRTPEQLKADLGFITQSVTIPATGWAYNSAAGCYRKGIDNAKITEEMSVDLNFDLASLAIAEKCGVKSVTESYNGGFYIYADAVPSAAMVGTILTR